MPETDSYSYFSDLLDTAVADPEKYENSVTGLQYFSDILQDQGQRPDIDPDQYYDDAKDMATQEILESREDPDLYGFIPTGWMPDWMKAGYNNSIEGLSYQLATGNQFYDLSLIHI